MYIKIYICVCVYIKHTCIYVHKYMYVYICIHSVYTFEYAHRLNIVYFCAFTYVYFCINLLADTREPVGGLCSHILRPAVAIMCEW